MAGTNWTQPLITDTYTAVLSELMTRDVSAATMFNSGMAADTSIPTGAIQWDATNLRFNIWSGTAWGALTPSYGFNISGTAAGLSATLAVTSGGTGVTTSTGTGSNVLSISPTLATPVLGTPTSGVLSNCIGYPYANLSGTVPTWNQNTTGSSASCTGNAVTATNATTATTATTVSTTVASAAVGTTQAALTGGTKIATCGYADASATAAAAGVVVSGRLIAFTTITASGTFTKNAATTKIVAQIWGGGGGGIGNSSGTLSGFGGNAGSGVLTVISSPPSSISVTVGAGGSGAISFGSSGGNTSFNSVVSVGGIPGIYNYSQGNGTNGQSAVGQGGQGGTGSGVSAAANSAAGGGGGGYNSGTPTTGGNGGSGVIFVWEYA